MRVFSIAKGFHKLSRQVAPELKEKERDRIRAITLWQRTKDMPLVCETFGMGRATLYRWIRRYNPKDLTSVKDRSRRPHSIRKPKWSYELIGAVKALREQYPRWGKDKLVVLLIRQGWKTSTSTVGRILTHLKKKGQIVEPEIRHISTKRKLKRPYATRKPKGYEVVYPGDLVEIDTLDVRPLPGVILKQFTARDIISKWDVIEVRSSATAKTAEEFLCTLRDRTPFSIRAIQVDGGGEFYAQFESACRERGILLFVLPPKSPKLNGHACLLQTGGESKQNPY